MRHIGGMEPGPAEPGHTQPRHMTPAGAEPGRWPYRPTAIWRKLVAVMGLGAFTALCVIALVALVAVGAAVGALVLEALIG